MKQFPPISFFVPRERYCHSSSHTTVRAVPHTVEYITTLVQNDLVLLYE